MTLNKNSNKKTVCELMKVASMEEYNSPLFIPWGTLLYEISDLAATEYCPKKCRLEQKYFQM
jgi:hypothetical protein